MGKTPMYIAINKKLLIIAVSDVVKENSKLAISKLQQMGIKVMITGDNARIAKLSASKLELICACVYYRR